MEQPGKNFICTMKFVKDTRTVPKRGVGANTLYNTRKGNSYFLLDMEKLIDDDDKATSVWTIHTNEKDFLKKDNIKSFASNRRNPNQKFIISQFLTLFFKRQKAIPSKKRNYYS